MACLLLTVIFFLKEKYSSPQLIFAVHEFPLIALITHTSLCPRLQPSYCSLLCQLGPLTVRLYWQASNLLPVGGLPTKINMMWAGGLPTKIDSEKTQIAKQQECYWNALWLPVPPQNALWQHNK